MLLYLRYRIRDIVLEVLLCCIRDRDMCSCCGLKRTTITRWRLTALARYCHNMYVSSVEILLQVRESQICVEVNVHE